MKEVVIGASGLVGAFLLENTRAKNANAIGTFKNQEQAGLLPLDITNPQETAAFLEKHQPEILYVPAAYPNVDGVEKDPEGTHAINVGAIENLAKLLKGSSTKLVYFSSDYVFDGTAGPYCETDTPNPTSVYGKQKLQSENAIQAALSNFLILRITVVFGWEAQGKNFVSRLQKTLRDNLEMKVPSDQIGSPTYAPNLAEGACQLARSDNKGIFHLAGPKLASRYQFALDAANIFGLDSNLIKPISTKELGQLAPRPLKAGMIVDKAQKALPFPLMEYDEGLKQMKDRFCD